MGMLGRYEAAVFVVSVRTRLQYLGPYAEA